MPSQVVYVRIMVAGELDMHSPPFCIVWWACRGMCSAWPVSLMLI